MKYEIEIDGLPEGWEPVAFRVAKAGDNYWDEVEGTVRLAKTDMEYRYVIVEKKRWRSEEGGDYYIVTMDYGMFLTGSMEETLDQVDRSYHASGNYFQTEEQAQAVADKINQLLQDAHK